MKNRYYLLSGLILLFTQISHSRTSNEGISINQLERVNEVRQSVVVAAPLINDVPGGGSVSVTAINTQNATNIPENTLDQVPTSASKWADMGDVNNRGVITYDLGSVYDLESINIATSGAAGKFYTYGIEYSIDGANYTALSDIISNEDTEFKAFPFLHVARYVKITGKGNSTSAYSTITEIEFYGTVNLSTKSFDASKIAIYPVPAQQTLSIDLGTENFTTVLVYSMDGKLVKTFDKNTTQSATIDVSSLSNGMYVFKILNKNVPLGSKQVVVSH